MKNYSSIKFWKDFTGLFMNSKRSQKLWFSGWKSSLRSLGLWFFIRNKKKKGFAFKLWLFLFYIFWGGNYCSQILARCSLRGWNYRQMQCHAYMLELAGFKLLELHAFSFTHLNFKSIKSAFFFLHRKVVLPLGVGIK